MNIAQTNKIYADLHNHTTFSDGQMTPQQLLQAAVHSGLKAVAVTDHDTIDGLYESVQAARLFDIDLVCGMEVTIRFTEPLFRGSLHILAYFDRVLLDHADFKKDTSALLSQGRGDALTKVRIEAINQCFASKSSHIPLPRPLMPEDVYRHGHRISRRHFALALADLGIEDNEKISRIIGNDSPAYVPAGITLELLPEYFARYPLILILAHPAAGSFPGDSHYKEVLPPLDIVEQILPRFIKTGLDGLEIEYPGHTSEHKKYLRKLMKIHDLKFITGGSDSHDDRTRPIAVNGITQTMFGKIKNEIKCRTDRYITGGKVR